MTEREKMLAGEIYDCGDEQLIERWHLAKQLQKKYSETDSRNRNTLNSILDELIGGRGDNVWIAAPFDNITSNVPPISLTNVPGVSLLNVPPVSLTNVPEK